VANVSDKTQISLSRGVVLSQSTFHLIVSLFFTYKDARAEYKLAVTLVLSYKSLSCADFYSISKVVGIKKFKIIKPKNRVLDLWKTMLSYLYDFSKATDSL